MSIEGEAKLLLSNEAFVAALQGVELYHMGKAMLCAPKDDHGRRIHLEHAKNVRKIVGHLNALIVAPKTGEEVNADKFYEEQAKGVFARILK